MILASSLAALCLLSSGPSTALSSFPATGLSPLGGPDVEEIAAKLASDQPAADRISAAQELADLGKKSAKVVPALIMALNDTEPEVVDSVGVALQKIGKKAREPLQVILTSGEYDGTPIAKPAVIKTLLTMGKKARGIVEDHMDSVELGPAKIELMSSLGATGLPFFAKSFGTQDGTFDVEMMRALRTFAAQEYRAPESIAEAAELVESPDQRLALETAWLQSPDAESLAQYGAWLESDNPMLVDTGLWVLGLLGKDAISHAGVVAQYLDAEDATTRATALWTLTSFVEPGPGPAIVEIAASFPGASKAMREKLAKKAESEVHFLWSNTAKPLGYRGRIGTKARAFWGLAPTWTAKTVPVPEGPDRSKVPAELLAMEERLFEIASSSSGVEARLASDALAAFGNKQERSRDLWLSWLEAEDAMQVRSALKGLLPFGRDLIMMKQSEEPNEKRVAAHLEHLDTMVPAAQLLTKIMTPTAWSSVVERMTRLKGTPPLAMIAAIGRYDKEALRPYLPRIQELYEEGHYMYSAFLIKFGPEVLSSFEKELSSKLTDRRMVAVESLGHVGKDARPLLGRLRQIKDKNQIIQKLVKDAVRRIQ